MRAYGAYCKAAQIDFRYQHLHVCVFWARGSRRVSWRGVSGGSTGLPLMHLYRL